MSTAIKAVWEPFEGWSCDRLTDYIADRLQKGAA